jgi:hypothetical protein
MNLKSPRDDRGLFVMIISSIEIRINFYMAFGICKLCGQSKNLIDAHIIPASFWSVGSKPLAMFSDINGAKPRKSPIGIYDSNILCDNCDNELGKLDQYALENLIRKPGTANFSFDGVTKKYTPIDVGKIHNFILSVAWRASKSKHDFYAEIGLGPYEDKFGDAFKLLNASSLRFDIFIAEFDTSVLPYLQPKSVKVDNVNGVLLYLGRFKIFVKTDQRTLHNTLGSHLLQEGNKIISSVESWAKSREKQMADRILQKNPRPKFWK